MKVRGMAMRQGVVARILVVEDDEEWREAHEYNLRRWGYEVFVAEGMGKTLIDDAVVKARHHQCHLALVDMCLLDDYGYDDSGLKLVQRLLPTRSIMVSAYGTPALATEAMTVYGAVGFVGKEENPARLPMVMAREVEVCCRQGIGIHWIDQRPLLPREGSWSWQEVEEVLQRLFPKAQLLQIRSLSSREEVTQPAPRLRALVLQVWADDLQPVFVKVALAERIQGEAMRYEQHINGRLAGHRHARLVNHVVLWNLGAVCYELLDVQLKGVRPFSRFFAEESATDMIGRVLEDFFAGTWSEHYGRREMRQMGLGEAYGEVWGHDLRERVGRYVAEERPLTLVSPSAPLPNPLCWVYQRLKSDPVRPLLVAVTHGDLHGDNMMVDVNGRICVIDYERTGWGPIYQDFIELETDMVVRLTAVYPTHPLELYKLFLTLTHPTSLTTPIPALDKNAPITTQKTWLVIRHLRQLAHRVTGIDNMEQYLWGLLLNAVFRATMLRRMIANGSRTHDAEYQRALLWGSLICQRLEELEHDA